jgi:multidrug efflux system outer membrane protein
MDMKMNIGNWAPAYAGVTMVLLLSACATVPPIDPASLPTVPAAFKEGDGRWTVAAPAAAQPRGEWWKAFSDPMLDDLVARADRSNTTIQVAAARLEQARSLVRAADAELLPQVGASAGVERGDGLSITNAPAGRARNFGTAAVNASYEVDLFGKLRQASRAAALDARSSAALLQSTRLLVEADVAQAYLQLRALDAERALVRRTLDAYRGTLDLTQRRYRAGDVAELDVSRAQTEVASTEAEALSLDRRRAALEHAIAVLVGEVASTFAIAEAQWTTALPVVPAGVPSTVLTRRPDVAAAQDALLASQARVGVAKAAWFPDIALTATGGYASTDLGDLFKWSARAWGVGALLATPIFDGGRRNAAIAAAGADMDAALARYREQILVAFRDVEDQLAALRLLAGEAQAQDRAVASASRATALSDARYRNGLVSQLDLLDAQRSELRNRRQALQVKSAQYQATVGLVRALGGDWEARS